MSDIKDLNIYDVDKFLSNNNMSNLSTKDKYEKAFNLMKKKDTSFTQTPLSIIEWMMAYNIVQRHIKIPDNIDNFNPGELSKLLDIKTNDINIIKNVINFTKPITTINIFPIKWFEDETWEHIQLIGQIEDSRYAYVKIPFGPYFTIKYSQKIHISNIRDSHKNLTDKFTSIKIETISNKLFRIYSLNKNDYHNIVSFYKKYGLGDITDENQNIKNKFFSEKQINPGSWQRATDIEKLHGITSCDLEFTTKNISNSDLAIDPPIEKVVFFDIEVISEDNISFPDSESLSDNIFAFSLVDTSKIPIRNLVYINTNLNIPKCYHTDKNRTQEKYNVEIIKAKDEKDLIVKFLAGLQEIRPYRVVSMNGKNFDLNYIGSRCKLLGITLPNFTPMLSCEPYFHKELVVRKEPFPSAEEVWLLSIPSISQIDILDFYRRHLHQLGNHKLETISQYILGKGKTGLDVQDMFSKYRSGDIDNLLEIIDYSIVDSILLLELWETSKINKYLQIMSNQWKNDSEYILNTRLDVLFEDLIRYIKPNIPPKKFRQGKSITTERRQGIHHNVYIYSLSEIYLMFLQKINDPLAIKIASCFINTNDGIIPFDSGYFPVAFYQISNFITEIIPMEKIIWIERNSFAVVGDPIPLLKIIEYNPLVIVHQKSWIIVNKYGLVFKKGSSAIVKPPFPLIEKYINYVIYFMIENPKKNIILPEFESDFEDFVIEEKITYQNFMYPPKRKSEIVKQLKESGVFVSKTWRKIKYIKTIDGPIIEEIYSLNPQKYVPLLDMKYYNKTIDKALSFF